MTSTQFLKLGFIDSANLDLELDVAFKTKEQVQNTRLNNIDDSGLDNDQNMDSIDTRTNDGIWNQVSLTQEQINKIIALQPNMPNEYQLQKSKYFLEYLEDFSDPTDSRYR